MKDGVALWLARAEHVLETARMIAGADPYSACNRAYYGIFYAARAALIAVGQEERAQGKTHAGAIAAFSEFVILPGHVDAVFGKAFGQLNTRRIAADYIGDEIEPAEAAEAIEIASKFVEAIKAFLVR